MTASDPLTESRKALSGKGLLPHLRRVHIHTLRRSRHQALPASLARDISIVAGEQAAQDRARHAADSERKGCCGIQLQAAPLELRWRHG